MGQQVKPVYAFHVNARICPANGLPILLPAIIPGNVAQVLRSLSTEWHSRLWLGPALAKLRPFGSKLADERCLYLLILYL